MILVVDNHDSFTWNLVHYLRELGAQVRVARADEIGANDSLASGAEGIVISPGPGGPEDAGVSVALVSACAEEKRPLLGVCLGHQAIVHAFGGSVVQAEQPMHGKTCPLTHDGTGVFAGLPSPFTATRYHSLAADPQSMPECLLITATAPDATVQGIRHRDLPIHGVQFHPESITSEHGHRLLQNFLELAQRGG